MVVYEAETVRVAEQRFRECARPGDRRQGLPDGDGVDLIKTMHAIDERVPILMLTGHASVDLAVQAMKFGAENCLTKPIHPAALFAVVQRVLDNLRDRRREIARTAREMRSYIVQRATWSVSGCANTI
jgi:FixJ family two-component response regulator